MCYDDTITLLPCDSFCINPRNPRAPPPARAGFTGACGGDDGDDLLDVTAVVVDVAPPVDGTELGLVTNVDVCSFIKLATAVLLAMCVEPGASAGDGDTL
jgi:hypothetical protein